MKEKETLKVGRTKTPSSILLEEYMKMGLRTAPSMLTTNQEEALEEIDKIEEHIKAEFLSIGKTMSTGHFIYVSMTRHRASRPEYLNPLNTEEGNSDVTSLLEKGYTLNQINEKLLEEEN